MTQRRVESLTPASTWAVIAAAAAALSLFVPMTFDEAIWVWAGQEIFAGGVPYREVVDHKTILVFAIEGLIDLAPGSFEVARAVGVGVTIAAIGIMADRIFRGMGGSDRTALRIGLVSSAFALVQTRLVSTVELWATAAILGAVLAVTNRKYRLAALVAFLGACIDIRAVLLAPAIAWFAAEHGGRPALKQFVALVAPLLLIAITAVLTIPDARFGILELASASRSRQFDLFNQAMVGVRALILPAVLVPILVGVNRAAFRSAIGRSGVFFLGSAIAIAIVSRLAFHRYWLFVVPAIPLIASVLQNPDPGINHAGPAKRTMTASLIALALLPGVFRVVDEIVVITREPLETYSRVALELKNSLATGQSFVHYPDKPYLPAYVPERFAAPSVVMHYYVKETERRELALSQLEASIDAATVIVDEGQLERPSGAITPSERKVLEIFRTRLSEFPCTQVIGAFTLRWRAAACPVD